MDKGFNFRATSGFVTDVAPSTYVLATDVYPTTRNGVTFGWSNTISSRDRNAGIDARLAGICRADLGSIETFRVDLSQANTYDIHLAYGDNDNQLDPGTITVKDNASTVLTLAPGLGGAAWWSDAVGTWRTPAANWVSGETGNSQVFASTIFTIQSSQADFNSAISHLRLIGATPEPSVPVAANYSMFPKPKLRRPITAGRVI